MRAKSALTDFKPPLVQTGNYGLAKVANAFLLSGYKAVVIVCTDLACFAVYLNIVMRPDGLLFALTEYATH